MEWGGEGWKEGEKSQSCPCVRSTQNRGREREGGRGKERELVQRDKSKGGGRKTLVVKAGRHRSLRVHACGEDTAHAPRKKVD